MAFGEYEKVLPKRYPPRSSRETAEGKFWRSFKCDLSERQVGFASTCIDFCPTAPYDFAVTSSTRVMVYNGVTREVKRTIARFGDVAYSGRFRSDGKLLVAGGESSIVQVFDATSRTILRKFKGHKGAVHATHFAGDKVHVVSGGDDCSVRLWDLPSAQEAVATMASHSDYVRSLARNRVSPHVWASGSYDHSVRLWDIRSAKCILTLQHGQPVEDVVFMPSGTLLASAGGNYACVWDIVGGGRRLYTLGNHQKTVTSLCVTPAIAVGPANRPLPPRLLTGSLDCHVKTYDPDTFTVSHAAVYASPVLSVAAAANGATMAVAMASGLVAIRHRKLAAKAIATLTSLSMPARVPGLRPLRRRHRPVRPLRANTFRYFLRGRSEKAAAEDFLVQQQRRVHLAAHDRLLRRFRHSEALTAALDVGRPEVVMAVMEELSARGTLVQAMANRQHHLPLLLPLVTFITKHVTSPRHAALLVPVACILLDLYASSLGIWPAVDHQVALLRRRVATELDTQHSLLSLQGMLEPLIRTSATTTGTGTGAAV